MKISTTNPPKVGIIVVHYINLEDTLECLISLSEVNYPNFDVFLVNNGSTDFDENKVRNVFLRITIISLKENLGYAGGNNIALVRAIRCGAEFLLLLNNDTVVSKDILWNLLPAFEEAGTGIVGPIIEYYYRPGKIWFAGGRFNQLIGYSYRNKPLAPFDNHLIVEWINGCAFLVKSEVVNKIGFLWEPFFLNSEDIDFCLRANKSSYKCIQVGKVLVRHKVSASGGIRGSDYFSPDKAYYFARNHFLLLKRNSSGLFLLTGWVSQFVIILPFWTIQCVRSGNLRVLMDYLVGMWDGLIGRTGKRSTIASLKKS